MYSILVKSKQVIYKGPALKELNPEDNYMEVVVETDPPMTEDFVEELLSFSACAVGTIEPLDSEDQEATEKDVDSSPSEPQVTDKPEVNQPSTTQAKEQEKQPEHKSAAKRTTGPLIKVDPCVRRPPLFLQWAIT